MRPRSCRVLGWLLVLCAPVAEPTDLYSTYSDADFRLGLNAAQTTPGAVGQLTGATLKR